MVRTSMSRGTFSSASGASVSSAAHMIGSAAFFAPETRTSPASGRPARLAHVRGRQTGLGTPASPRPHSRDTRSQLPSRAAAA